MKSKNSCIHLQMCLDKKTSKFRKFEKNTLIYKMFRLFQDIFFRKITLIKKQFCFIKK